MKSVAPLQVPTLRRIAAACGVDVSTVSRALNDHAGISRTTKQKVRRTAEKLGWRPNPLAAAYMSHLRSTRSPVFQGTVAFVAGFTRAASLSDLPPYHQVVWEGARELLEAQGFATDVIFLRECGNNVARLDQMLKSRGVVGLILHRDDLPDRAYEALDWDSYAAATWGFGLTMPLHRAAHSVGHAVRVAVATARERGYQRIAMVIAKYLDDLSDQAASASFLYEQRDAEPLRYIHLYTVSGNSDHKQQIRDWLSGTDPEVIIGDALALEVVNSVGKRIPEDVAFITPYWGATRPYISGIDPLTPVVGAHVAELVVSQILANQRGLPEVPKLVLHDGKWRDGESLPWKTPQRRGRQPVRRQVSRSA
jgi:LacI family transcriptional regulator